MPTETDKNTLNELAKPFPPEAIMWKPGGGGKKLAYITARHVMNRLNSVVGVRGWWDEYEPVSQPKPGVMCKLTVVIDGEPTTKYGFGGFEEMQTPDDSFKSGESNSLRRAAVKFGIGHYLYNNGSVVFNDDEPGGEEVYGNQPAPRPAQPAQAQYSQPAPISGGSGQPAPQANGNGQGFGDGLPKHGGQLFAWAKTRENNGEQGVIQWLDNWGQNHGCQRSYKQWSEQQVQQAAAEYVASRGGSAPQPVQQAAPQSNGQQFYDTPTDLEKPADGRGLFKLIKKIEEKYPTLGFLNPVNEYGKLHHLNGRMVDWSPADVQRAWEYLGSLVTKQKQNGNIPAGDTFGLNGQPATQQPAAPYDGPAMMAKVKELAASIVSLRGEQPTDEAITEELMMIMSDCHGGKSFSVVLTDPQMGAAVYDSVKRDLDGRRQAAGVAY